jgi:hypothetical protein
MTASTEPWHGYSVCPVCGSTDIGEGIDEDPEILVVSCNGCGQVLMDTYVGACTWPTSPPTVLQLRGPEGEVLWEGPTPLFGLTDIVGTICSVTDKGGVLLYTLPQRVVMHAGETLTFGAASSGEVSIEIFRP